MADEVKAIVPTRVLEGEIVDSEHAAIEVTMRQGTRNEIVRVPIPIDLHKMTPLQKAVILRSTPMWASYDIPYLLFVQLWCDQRGLDPASGDVYPIDGKLNTSDDAKIKTALRSGNVEYLTVTDIIKATNPLTGANDFYCEATLKLKSETEPRKYKAWRSEWYNEKNANWKQRPTDALQRKAQARVCHFAVAMGAEGEDFITVSDPAGTPLGQKVAAKQLTSQLEQSVELAAKSS